MGEYSGIYVGFDTAKAKHAVALAMPGRDGEVRYLGEIASTPATVGRLLRKLGERHGALRCVYEAGPIGYGLYRQVTDLGHTCEVVAPSLIPSRPGERVKTNRRDAVSLARLHRAGELTPIWVPDAAHEAVRELVRAREAAQEDRRRKRQQLQSFLLRHGRIYRRGEAWTQVHGRWLAEQVFAAPALQLVFQDLVDAARDAAARVGRLEGLIAGAVPGWALAPLVEAYQAMRGVSFITAVTIAAEVGDPRRFENPRRLMAYLGLVPSERSTGEAVRRGGLTKAGSRRARRLLVEAAWTYRFPARVSVRLQRRLEEQPKAVRDIAWKAQLRLCARFRRMTTAGKHGNVVIAAIAREIAAFLWAIGQAVLERLGVQAA
jgi:transposase